MLAHRLRRWPNIKPALRQRLVFTGLLAHTATRIILACNTFCDRHAHHVSGRCLDSIATCYYNTAGPRTRLWQAKLAGQGDAVYWDFFQSKLVINIIYTLDTCICPDD